MYGAFQVFARDVYFGMIVKSTAMPIKNTNNNTKKVSDKNTKNS